MLAKENYIAASKTIGCEAAVLAAFAQVESNGVSTNPDGSPKVQYEPYQMYKRLKAHFGPSKASDVLKAYPDLVKTKSGDYNKYSTEFQQFVKAAVLIDLDCAVECCSWGMFQIMGNNWRSLGYSSIHAFMEKVYKGDEGQLSIFVKFITSNKPLLNAVKAKDFAAMARWYNGVNYRANNYDEKLKSAYAKMREEF